jgi:2-C-methyl-D-erythritol 4-phosphate cytidylyltransferase
MMKTVAIIPAAGAGVRMGTEQAKQFLDLCDKPLLAVTLEKFQVCPSVDSIILVVPSHDVDYCQKEIVDRYQFNKVHKVVAGGERRQDSVRLGLEATEGQYEWVLIHDGVRPFIEPSLIEEMVKAGTKERAVITAMPAKETVKKVGENGLIIKTYDRKQVYLVQTPQAFRFNDIMAAHQKAFLENWDEMTDDALLIEKMGIRVKVVPGSENNIKVTTPHDLELIRFLMERKK